MSVCLVGLQCLGAAGTLTDRSWSGAHSICTRACATDADCGDGAHCFQPGGTAEAARHCLPDACLRNLGAAEDQPLVPVEYRRFPYCGW